MQTDITKKQHRRRKHIHIQHTGTVEESTNEKVNKTTYEYNRLGRITKATDKAGV